MPLRPKASAFRFFFSPLRGRGGAARRAAGRLAVLLASCGAPLPLKSPGTSATGGTPGVATYLEDTGLMPLLAPPTEAEAAVGNPGRVAGGWDWSTARRVSEVRGGGVVRRFSSLLGEASRPVRLAMRYASPPDAVRVSLLTVNGVAYDGGVDGNATLRDETAYEYVLPASTPYGKLEFVWTARRGETTSQSTYTITLEAPSPPVLVYFDSSYASASRRDGRSIHALPARYGDGEAKRYAHLQILNPLDEPVYVALGDFSGSPDSGLSETYKTSTDYTGKSDDAPPIPIGLSELYFHPYYFDRAARRANNAMRIFFPEADVTTSFFWDGGTVVPGEGTWCGASLFGAARDVTGPAWSDVGVLLDATDTLIDTRRCAHVRGVAMTDTVGPKGRVADSARCGEGHAYRPILFAHDETDNYFRNATGLECVKTVDVSSGDAVDAFDQRGGDTLTYTQTLKSNPYAVQVVLTRGDAEEPLSREDADASGRYVIPSLAAVREASRSDYVDVYLYSATSRSTKALRSTSYEVIDYGAMYAPSLSRPLSLSAGAVVERPDMVRLAYTYDTSGCLRYADSPTRGGRCKSTGSNIIAWPYWRAAGILDNGSEREMTWTISAWHGYNVYGTLVGVSQEDSVTGSLTFSVGAATTTTTRHLAIKVDTRAP